MVNVIVMRFLGKMVETEATVIKIGMMIMAITPVQVMIMITTGAE